jgi:hypothetical protein
MEKIFEDSTRVIKADKDTFKIFAQGQNVFEMTWKEFFAINLSSYGDTLCHIIFGSLHFSDAKKVTSTLYQWSRDNSEYVKKLRG